MAIAVTEIIDILERVGCQFWACEGPDKTPEDMITCIRCSLLHELYNGDAIEDDRTGPPASDERARGNNQQ